MSLGNLMSSRRLYCRLGCRPPLGGCCGQHKLLKLLKCLKLLHLLAWSEKSFVAIPEVKKGFDVLVPQEGKRRSCGEAAPMVNDSGGGQVIHGISGLCRAETEVGVFRTVEDTFVKKSGLKNYIMPYQLTCTYDIYRVYDLAFCYFSKIWRFALYMQYIA